VSNVKSAIIVAALASVVVSVMLALSMPGLHPGAIAAGSSAAAAASVVVVLSRRRRDCQKNGS